MLYRIIIIIAIIIIIMTVFSLLVPVSNLDIMSYCISKLSFFFFFNSSTKYLSYILNLITWASM